MDFISLNDIQDSILNCTDDDVSFANDRLEAKAKSFGLTDDEIVSPCRESVKQLGTAIACRQCALRMIGSDTTVMINGQRGDDIFLQKYKTYAEQVKTLSASMDFTDFAGEETESAGKGGVGMIRLYRA